LLGLPVLGLLVVEWVRVGGFLLLAPGLGLRLFRSGEGRFADCFPFLFGCPIFDFAPDLLWEARLLRSLCFALVAVLFFFRPEDDREGGLALAVDVFFFFPDPAWAMGTTRVVASAASNSTRTDLCHLTTFTLCSFFLLAKRRRGGFVPEDRQSPSWVSASWAVTRQTRTPPDTKNEPDNDIDRETERSRYLDRKEPGLLDLMTQKEEHPIERICGGLTRRPAS
jgi:hypothetical protein